MLIDLLAMSLLLRKPDHSIIATIVELDGSRICVPKSQTILIQADHSFLQVRKSIKPAKPRATLQPGAILILLAGRFRGKRVVLLKHLSQGVLLVTGPFKVNGVPLRRVNARYVIATSGKVELKGVDEKTVEKVAGDGYFTREKKQEKSGEEAFFKQGEKPEVSSCCMIPQVG